MIEAGELGANAPLRACENAKTAAAIACYPDGERDLDKLIDDELRARELADRTGCAGGVDALLGGDRQASRNELDRS